MHPTAVFTLHLGTLKIITHTRMCSFCNIQLHGVYHCSVMASHITSWLFWKLWLIIYIMILIFAYSLILWQPLLLLLCRFSTHFVSRVLNTWNSTDLSWISNWFKWKNKLTEPNVAKSSVVISRTVFLGGSMGRVLVGKAPRSCYPHC